jgi:FtsP/CotA-like multicopper oxidase with cupredoxin domain
VIQDRQFNSDGSFLYPVSDIPGATWIGEYFGDVMLVNGKVWPFLELEPRMYRLRILNGCNARILSLDLGGPVGRTPFDAAAYDEAYEPAGGGGVPGGIDPTPFATGPMEPPDLSERAPRAVPARRPRP